ncbi:MAG: hypothetical protein WCP20_22310 [Desulfuromonadales bacterium]
MKIDLKALKKTNSYLAGDTSCLPPDYAQRSQDYKRRVAGCYIPIQSDDMAAKATAPPMFATKKLNGELAVIFFDGTDAVIAGSNGTVRSGIPCIDEASALLKKARLKQAVIAAELYVAAPGARERVFQVKQALGSDGDPASLALAPFDILEIDSETASYGGYDELHAALVKLFGTSEKCRPVELKKCGSAKEVSAIFDEWVTKGSAEGIVLRSTMPIVYKVKPKHSIDAVIIGFTEGDGDNRGTVRDLLFALLHDNGVFQVPGKTGNGLSDAQKKDFFTLLSAIPAESRYIETDSRNVAYRMVQPKYVAEVSFIDLMTESSANERKQNPLISWDGKAYAPLAPCNGVSMSSPVFERMRDDKLPDADNAGISQLTRLLGDEAGTASEAVTLTPSTVIRRELYTKGAGDKLMLQKYLVWKSNKETADTRFPAYVLHYTDFSVGRKEMLKRELRASCSEEQILALCDEMIAENVKKGWERK